MLRETRFTGSSGRSFIDLPWKENIKGFLGRLIYAEHDRGAMDEDSAEENIGRLKEYLLAYGRPLVIAFSGGVDSGLLVAAAIGANAEFSTITAVHQATPETDIERVKKAGKEIGFFPAFLDLDIHTIPNFVPNSRDRCYYCKREMMRRIAERAAGMYAEPLIIDGTNADDLRDGRPGIAALREMAIKSPLAELGISKAEVREMARALGIPHDTPAQPCYATRIPHGERITEEKIRMIAEAEAVVRGTGAGECRVRFIEPETASMEIPEDYRGDFPLKDVVGRLKKIGFGEIVLSEKALKRR